MSDNLHCSIVGERWGMVEGGGEFLSDGDELNNFMRFIALNMVLRYMPYSPYYNLLATISKGYTNVCQIYP